MASSSRSWRSAARDRATGAWLGVPPGALQRALAARSDALEGAWILALRAPLRAPFWAENGAGAVPSGCRFRWRPMPDRIAAADHAQQVGLRAYLRLHNLADESERTASTKGRFKGDVANA